MTRKILFNGKFLRAAPTGVHRVAMELVNGMAQLQAEGAPEVAGLDMAIWFPADGAANARAIALPAQRVLSPTTGRLWEQVTLPLVKGNRTLVNLCNVGPVLSRDAVTMIHDAQVHITPASYSRGFRWWYQVIQPRLARRNRMILTVSEFSRQAIADAGLCAIDKIHVVHNGVDHVLREPADPAVLDRLGCGRRPFVLALANTQEHKNLALLLAAFASPDMAGIDLVLFGSASREDLSARGLFAPGNVLLAGRVSDAELRALMEAALCIAFPSTTEGFGLPPLEAMLLGCPAIVAPCGALPEVCDAGALYAAPDDPEAWRRQIHLLADAPDIRETWRNLGRQQAAAFTWRRASLRLAELLRQAFAPGDLKP